MYFFVLIWWILPSFYLKIRKHDWILNTDLKGVLLFNTPWDHPSIITAVLVLIQVLALCAFLICSLYFKKLLNNLQKPKCHFKRNYGKILTRIWNYGLYVTIDFKVVNKIQLLGATQLHNHIIMIKSTYCPVLPLCWHKKWTLVFSPPLLLPSRGNSFALVACWWWADLPSFLHFLLCWCPGRGRAPSPETKMELLMFDNKLNRSWQEIESFLTMQNLW